MPFAAPLRTALSRTIRSSMAAPRPAHGCRSGALLGRFGVLLQALLALCAFSTLMREYRGGSGHPLPAGGPAAPRRRSGVGARSLKNTKFCANSRLGLGGRDALGMFPSRRVQRQMLLLKNSRPQP